MREQAEQENVGKTRAGAAVAVRSEIGVAPWPGNAPSSPKTLVENSAAGVYINGVIRGGLALGSVYLKDSEGMGATNTEICKKKCAENPQV